MIDSSLAEKIYFRQLIVKSLKITDFHDTSVSKSINHPLFPSFVRRGSRGGNLNNKTRNEVFNRKTKGRNMLEAKIYVIFKT